MRDEVQVRRAQTWLSALNRITPRSARDLKQLGLSETSKYEWVLVPRRLICLSARS
jgi:hypothetical protein